jgi:hypothetical protein
VVLDARGHEALVELAQYPFRTSVYLVQPVQPGETVAMRLQEVDPWRLVARFSHVTAAG